VRQEWNAVRPERALDARLRVHERLDDVRESQHGRRENVDPRTLSEKELGDAPVTR